MKQMHMLAPVHIQDLCVKVESLSACHIMWLQAIPFSAGAGSSPGGSGLSKGA